MIESLKSFFNEVCMQLSKEGVLSGFVVILATALYRRLLKISKVNQEETREVRTNTGLLNDHLVYREKISRLVDLTAQLQECNYDDKDCDPEIKRKANKLFISILGCISDGDKLEKIFEKDYPEMVRMSHKMSNEAINFYSEMIISRLGNV